MRKIPVDLSGEMNAVTKDLQSGDHFGLSSVVLQLPWAPADNVKESGNAYATEDLEVAATGAHSLRGPLVSSIFSLAARC
jgi:hypothetical protein